jgi:putative NADH-flavin reductase
MDILTFFPRRNAGLPRWLVNTLISTVALCSSVHVTAADIVIYGASGNFGSDIVTEALERGHHVKGVSRSPQKLTVNHPNFTAVKGDVTDLNSVLEIITGADAVIMSLRGNGSDNSAEETATYKGAATYIQAARKLGGKAPRVLQVGNQATLYSDGVIGFERGVAQKRYSEGSAMYGRVKAHLLVVDLYQAEPDLLWTLFAPSGSIGPGERKGTYKIGSQKIDGRGTGISQKDFAIAFIDEVEKPTAIQKVISIGY